MKIQYCFRNAATENALTVTSFNEKIFSTYGQREHECIAKINIAVFYQQEPELVFDLFLKYVSVCAIHMPNYLCTYI